MTTAASAKEIEELYVSRYASFRAGAVALTGSTEAVSDVVQEALAQALHDRERYCGEGSLAAWVWRIAFRIALRSRRNGRHEMTLEELLDAAPPPSSERDPHYSAHCAGKSPRPLREMTLPLLRTSNLQEWRRMRFRARARTQPFFCCCALCR